MSLAGLLQVAEGSPSERARLADVQIETLDLVLSGRPDDMPLSPTLRLAAVRAAIDRLHVWCPQLREAEKVAARHALRLASAGLELGRLAGAVCPPEADADESSWDTFFSGRGWDAETQQKILDALSTKRQLLQLVAALEREAERQDDRRSRPVESAPQNSGVPTDTGGPSAEPSHDAAV